MLGPEPPRCVHLHVDSPAILATTVPVTRQRDDSGLGLQLKSQDVIYFSPWDPLGTRLLEKIKATVAR